MTQKFQKSKTQRAYRRQILDEVIPYIKSGNAGMDDALYEVAYATCLAEAVNWGLSAGEFSKDDMQSRHGDRLAQSESFILLNMVFSRRREGKIVGIKGECRCFTNVTPTN